MIVSSDNTVVLGRRHLYMLPSAAGFMYAFLIAVLLIAAINYGNGMIFGLTFLLAAIGIVSMVHTHLNVSRLGVRAAPAPPVFAGETARFPVYLVNAASRARHGVMIELDGTVLAETDIEARGEISVPIPVRAQRRGWLTPPAIQLSSRFPLGLLYCWSRRVPISTRGLVYPAPAEDASVGTTGGDTGDGAIGEGDDFAGQREYRVGDSPRHVNWRALARGQGWITKEFGGGAGATVWLDWADYPGLDGEARLSKLCRAVLDAEQQGCAYGLRLPTATLAPAAGVEHQARCLERLALFEPGV